MPFSEKKILSTLFANLPPPGNGPLKDRDTRVFDKNEIVCIRQALTSADMQEMQFVGHGHTNHDD